MQFFPSLFVFSVSICVVKVTSVKCNKRWKYYNAFVLYYLYQVILYYLRLQFLSCGLFCEIIKALEMQWSRIIFLLFGSMLFFSIRNVKRNRGS